MLAAGGWLDCVRLMDWLRLSMCMPTQMVPLVRWCCFVSCASRAATACAVLCVPLHTQPHVRVRCHVDHTSPQLTITDPGPVRTQVGVRGEARRFRPGLDYTVAHYGILTR